MRRTGNVGFTLIEVMIGLALLGLALTVLIKSAAGSIFNARQAQMIGVVTDLGRAKMYDLEETLLKDGFNAPGLSDGDDECSSYEAFDDEGWPGVEWCAKVVQVELPSWDKLQDMSKAGSGSGSGAAGGTGSALGSALGEEPTGGFQDSALGGMLGMLGGGFGGAGGDADSQQGASFIQSQYSLVQQVLKDSIRKVTLDLRWEVMGSKRDMRVVAYFTDAAAMDKALQGLGSQEIPDAGSGSGSGSGSGRGSGSGSARPRPGSGSAK
ncbi:MAG: prepilin-type N-terminal cleavage/methylation domain-containing protein [Deltaproteobacteria bacterium]|nr:prepilin-type N-terminal cleavage/methylation domain-containing protein [Deltaproteobacteria bacterium]